MLGRLWCYVGLGDLGRGEELAVWGLRWPLCWLQDHVGQQGGPLVKMQAEGAWDPADLPRDLRGLFPSDFSLPPVHTISSWGFCKHFFVVTFVWVTQM